MTKKVILAFSGGLDTSVILKWLVDKGYDVVAYTADIGQKDDFDEIKEKALSVGAVKSYIVDLKREFVENYIFQALKANAIYEGRYLLGTAVARPLVAKHQVEVAKKEQTNTLAHGCTGKGNDQVRFELTWLKFMPNVEIISPWKNEEFLKKFKGRKDLIEYAKKKGIPIGTAPEKLYSIDENLMHTSYESGILEDIRSFPKKGLFKNFVFPQDTPNEEIKIIIEFEKGIPIKVIDKTNKIEVTGAVELFTYLNEIGARNGVGLVDMVENRFIGIKSRGVYIAPAATILWKAHQDLESITLDGKVLHMKAILSQFIGTLIYNGFWYSPEMEFLMAAVEHSQKNVCGRVYITLYKGNVMIIGRESDKSLYNEGLASMNEKGYFNPKFVEGFIKTIALRYKLGVKNEIVGNQKIIVE